MTLGQGQEMTLTFNTHISSLKVKVIYIWKLKLAFLRNHLANQSQILYVSFQELGNENLLTRWWSHYQDGRHAHIW